MQHSYRIKRFGRSQPNIFLTANPFHSWRVCLLNCISATDKPATMKAITTALFLVSTLLFACHPKDPEADLLIGSWNQVQYKAAADSAWRDNSSNWIVNVIFKTDGTVGTVNQMPFSGGWCNNAERYSLSNKTIRFDYGKANCIPIVNPGTPPDAQIIDLTSQSLVITRGTYWLKFERK